VFKGWNQNCFVAYVEICVACGEYFFVVPDVSWHGQLDDISLLAILILVLAIVIVVVYLNFEFPSYEYIFRYTYAGMILIGGVFISRELLIW
jgi:hypothetical protein